MMLDRVLLQQVMLVLLESLPMTRELRDRLMVTMLARQEPLDHMGKRLEFFLDFLARQGALHRRRCRRFHFVQQPQGVLQGQGVQPQRWTVPGVLEVLHLPLNQGFLSFLVHPFRLIRHCLEIRAPHPFRMNL